MSLLLFAATSFQSFNAIQRLIDETRRETRVQETLVIANQLSSRVHIAEDWPSRR